MWWLIIQRFPKCRNPFGAIFNGLHGKDNGNSKMKLSRLDPGRTAPWPARPFLLFSRHGITIAANSEPVTGATRGKTTQSHSRHLHHAGRR
jgi:hypothetical protein